MRVLISGGGTGGHVYPALAVATRLQADRSHTLPAADAVRMLPAESRERDAAASSAAHGVQNSVVWLGSEGGMEQELVERAGIEYYGISTGQLRGKNPLAAARNAGKMMAGVRQSKGLFSKLRPDVCLVTGGYVCAPAVIACKQRGIPVLIYLPDMAPGSAIRWLSRLAQRVAVSNEGAAAYFGGVVETGGKAVVTGYPVREELIIAARDRSAARQRLAESMQRPSLAVHDNLADERLPLVLIWGGSQGSRSINRATWDALPHLLQLAHVVHIVGVRDWAMGQAVMSERMADGAWRDEWFDRYHPTDYLHESMPWALAAADLTVARAGASILGEFPVAGLPSILVPLPIAGVNQLLNAQALEQRGAAVVVDDDALGAEMAPTITNLLTDTERLQRMAKAAQALAKPDAADRIIEVLEKLAMPGAAHA